MKCTLLELDPVQFVQSFFVQLWIRCHPFYLKLDQFPIQKCFSSGPEEAIPKAKHCLQTVCYWMKLDAMFCFFLDWNESKTSSRRVSLASENHPGTATNLIQQNTCIQNHMSLNFPLQEITTNWIDELLGEGALL